MSRTREPVAVIGVGNVVLCDDGLGVQAIGRLRERRLAENVVLVEGGTAGLLLLPELAGAGGAMIIDAVDCGARPGTVMRLEAADWADAFSAGMTSHDVGLRDLLGAAWLTGAWPEPFVLYGLQPASTAVGTRLTAPVAAAMDDLVDRVTAELASWNIAAA